MTCIIAGAGGWALLPRRDPDKLCPLIRLVYYSHHLPFHCRHSTLYFSMGHKSSVKTLLRHPTTIKSTIIVLAFTQTPPITTELSAIPASTKTLVISSSSLHITMHSILRSWRCFECAAHNLIAIRLCVRCPHLRCRLCSRRLKIFGRYG